MTGTARYQGELVHVIDAIHNSVLNRIEYLIHWGEPIWVAQVDLVQVRWIIK